MKITALNGKDWLRISAKRDPYGYSAIEIEASITPVASSFYAKQSDMHFDKVGPFADALDAFIMDRSLVPTLNGTYDSYLTFRAIGSKVRLEFAIGGRLFRDPHPYCLSGAFAIDQSFLNEYVSGFRQLAGAK